MTADDAKLIEIQLKAAREAGIKLPLEGSETITARQLEVYNEALLHEFGALLKNREDLCSPKHWQ